MLPPDEPFEAMTKAEEAAFWEPTPEVHVRRRFTQVGEVYKSQLEARGSSDSSQGGGARKDDRQEPTKKSWWTEVKEWYETKKDGPSLYESVQDAVNGQAATEAFYFDYRDVHSSLEGNE